MLKSRAINITLCLDIRNPFMNIDLVNIPTTIDLFHIALAVLALVFFIIMLIKGKGSSASEGNLGNETSPGAPADEHKPGAVKHAAQLKEAGPDAALQLLTLLQQDARFIDFIQEDLSAYSDADIGAAARVVHEGSKKTLNSYFDFAPVRSEEEETRLTLEAGFNPSEVRLTGNVVGQAPFSGTLIHKGWKITKVKLPKLAEGHDTRIIAPAEVEL
jgi:hypothetical protein